jgi:hypothetical protein
MDFVTCILFPVPAYPVLAAKAVLSTEIFLEIEKSYYPQQP